MLHIDSAVCGTWRAHAGVAAGYPKDKQVSCCKHRRQKRLAMKIGLVTDQANR